MMVDPTPVVGLPDAEYVEIFNATDFPIPLPSISIASGGAPAALDTLEGQLPVGAYAVLVKSAAAERFVRADVLVLTTQLPGLTNTFDQVSLFIDGKLVTEVHYSTEWYHDDRRDGGGYALEFTGNGELDCGGNWRASLDPSGGSPGLPNSVTGTRVDSLPPQPSVVDVSDSGAIIDFDEQVIPLVNDLFLLDGRAVSLRQMDERTYALDAELQPGRIYALSVLPDYSDCAGNFPQEPVVLDLFRPAPVAAGDVVINELLFNPVPGGEDFVELYNTSAQVVQLRGWQLANARSGNRPKMIDRSFLLPPGNYVVITPDTDDLEIRFSSTKRDNVLEASLPSLPNTSGNISLIDPTGVIIDAFTYHEEMHAPLLSDVEGVSLERLRTDVPAGDDGNWYSASSSSGFGTPTRANSQSRSADPTLNAEFALVETVFSPDGDGYQDVLELSYRVPVPGLLASVRIFDGQGRAVRDLPRSLLATRGTLQWDGQDATGEPSPVGAYVVLVEVFAPDGRTETHKFLAVLAG